MMNLPIFAGEVAEYLQGPADGRASLGDVARE